MTYTAFFGTIVHSLSLEELEIISNGLLIVDDDKGTIASLEKEVGDPEAALDKLDRPYKVAYCFCHLR